MSTSRNDISLSNDLVDLIKKTATVQGRKPEEVVEDAVTHYVSDKRWQRVLDYGKGQAKALGYTEEDVERLIHDSRAERDRSL